MDDQDWLPTIKSISADTQADSDEYGLTAIYLAFMSGLLTAEITDLH